MNGTTAFPLEAIEDIRRHPENYRLLRRVPLNFIDDGYARKTAILDAQGMSSPLPWRFRELRPGESTQSMVVLDTETTHIRPESGQIIELAMVGVTFSAESFEILSVDSCYDSFEDPGVPIPPEITDITGITGQMVKGCRLDTDIVTSLLRGKAPAAPLVVAHNAAFDRQFFERRFPSLTECYWGCSLKQVEWKRYGLSIGYSLQSLLMQKGYFYDAHRAFTDCMALVWLLYLMPEACRELVTEARKPEFRISVFNSYDQRVLLKARGYRFEKLQGAGLWYMRCPDARSAKAEKDYLASIGVPPQETADKNRAFYTVSELTALNRFRAQPGQ